MKSLVIVRSVNEFSRKLSVENGRIMDPGEPNDINPWDLYAVEAAFQIKEQYGGEIIVLSIGSDQTVKSIRRALALGCDEAIFISCSSSDLYDSKLVAYAIKSVIDIIGNPDLILGGYTNVGINDSISLIQLSRLLNIGIISFVNKIISIDESNQSIMIGRRLEGIMESLRTNIPVILTIDKEFGEPRYPSFFAIQKASKLPITTYLLDNLSAKSIKKMIEYIDLENFDWKRTQCEFINGSNAESIAQELINKLSSKGLI